MKVKITGNITNYESKSIGIFTTRQILFFVFGLFVGVISYFLIVNVLPPVFATVISTLIGLFIAACGIYKLGGLPLSNVLMRALRLAVGHGKRRYTTDNIYMEAEDEQKRKQK